MTKECQGVVGRMRTVGVDLTSLQVFGVNMKGPEVSDYAYMKCLEWNSTVVIISCSSTLNVLGQGCLAVIL